MKKTLSVMILTVALMVLASVPALAGAQDFLLINNTGSTIYNVYCSHADTNSWEEDILGGATILPGQAATITFSDADRTQYWDIRIVFDNGADLAWEDIDLTATSEITINSDGTARFQ